jgi:phosphate transport system substrate-binding protein
MASRALKDSELAKGLNPQVIALDGIVVIVNKDNTFTNLTTTQVKDIFIGEVTSWQGLNG